MSGAGAWYGRDMPEMWSSAQGADTRMAWDQVLAWRRTHDLLDFHQSRLRRAREELLSSWPPERSPAAAAFAAHIDDLLVAMDSAKVEAATNQDALAAILSSLRDTKNDMAVLVAEWEEHRRTPVVAGRSAVVPPAYTVTLRAQERMARNDQEVLAAYRTFVDITGPKLGVIGGPGSQADRGDGSTTRGGTDTLTPPLVKSPSEVDELVGPVDLHGVGLAGSSVAPPPSSSGPTMMPANGSGPPMPMGPGGSSAGIRDVVPPSVSAGPSHLVAGTFPGGRNGGMWVNRRGRCDRCTCRKWRRGPRCSPARRSGIGHWSTRIDDRRGCRNADVRNCRSATVERANR